MTTFKIQELESLGFEWDPYGAVWKLRLSELVDYRKIHGHYNVPYQWSENTKLAYWVSGQRKEYRLHLAGKTSHMTAFRIQALVDIGFVVEDLQQPRLKIKSLRIGRTTY
jgi:hypothetical protein